MIVLIDKSFEKDTNIISDKIIRKKIVYCIINVQEAKNIKDIRNIEKLKGFNIEYRI
jgi:hypothetical protein